MSSTVLSDLDINTTVPQPTTSTSTSTSTTTNKPKSMDYHRQVLQSRLEEDKSKQTYISPSDTILSPCTQKLSAFKEKRFMKAKPQSLFAKTSAKSMVNGGKNENIGDKEEGKASSLFTSSNNNDNNNGTEDVEKKSAEAENA